MTREHPIPSNKHSGAEQPSQATRLARTLVAQTLAYFAEHEARNLAMVRAHLMELVDERPALGLGQNLRSAHLLLGKYGAQFNVALQKALADGLSEELAAILPQQGRPARPSANDDALDGLSLSLIDVGEVERVLLLDRVAQRFGARYEAALEPLTQRLSVLFGHERTSIHDNPFQPVVLLRACARAVGRSRNRCTVDEQRDFAGFDRGDRRLDAVDAGRGRCEIRASGRVGKTLENSVGVERDVSLDGDRRGGRVVDVAVVHRAGRPLSGT